MSVYLRNGFNLETLQKFQLQLLQFYGDVRVELIIFPDFEEIKQDINVVDIPSIQMEPAKHGTIVRNLPISWMSSFVKEHKYTQFQIELKMPPLSDDTCTQNTLPIIQESFFNRMIPELEEFKKDENFTKCLNQMVESFKSLNMQHDDFVTSLEIEIPEDQKMAMLCGIAVACNIKRAVKMKQIIYLQTNLNLIVEFRQNDWNKSQMVLSMPRQTFHFDLDGGLGCRFAENECLNEWCEIPFNMTCPLQDFAII